MSARPPFTPWLGLGLHCACASHRHRVLGIRLPRAMNVRRRAEGSRARELAADGLRLGRRIGGRFRRAVDPARFLPKAGHRYRNSWRSTNVAQQMLELTDAQLQVPETVAPYVAFRELVVPLVDSPDVPRPARILDIGAGMGAYGELLDRWWPGRFDYVGADYSDEILTVAASAGRGVSSCRRTFTYLERWTVSTS